MLKDKELLENTRRQLEPLYSDFYPSSKQYKFVKRYEKQFTEKLARAADFVTTISSAMEFYTQTSTRELSEIESQKSLSFMEAFNYLSSVELVGTLFVDLAILLLIGKGYNLHMEPDYEHRFTRHAASLEDLESPTLPLSIKLDFLELHGLTFFSKWIDRVLRNKIAHLNFVIDENGDFFMLSKKGRRKKVDLSKKFSRFANCYYAQSIVYLENVIRIMKEEES